MNHGQRIREIREFLGMRTDEIAEKTGIDEERLAEIENGKVVPGISEIRKIAIELSISTLITALGGVKRCKKSQSA